jgi:hypothetical protein
MFVSTNVRGLLERCERACVRVAVAVRKLLKQTAGARDDASEDERHVSTLLSGAADYWLVDSRVVSLLLACLLACSLLCLCAPSRGFHSRRQLYSTQA